jgi:hypothetical protein
MSEFSNFRTTAEARAASVIHESRTFIESTNFNEIPSLSEAEDLAAEIRGNFAADVINLVLVESLVEQNGWRLRYRPMSNNPSLIQALLMPTMEDHLFSMVVSADLLKGEDASDVAAFLIGHEIAHTFFYNTTIRPARSRLTLGPLGRERDRRRSNEEGFCDHFSLHLTGVELPRDYPKFTP